MAGIIKNQILKHLSKFAKNLSSNSINVSTLRGEGELFNLELNEKVLTDLLELPNWMQIGKATVNKVSVKIQWTKLKSSPIHLYLDEVHVQMETCSELRPHGTQTDLSSYKSGTKYGFVDKVIDGMTVTVNSVLIRFISPSFNTSFQVSRIILISKSPSWQMSDLRMTRLKDLNQQHVLIFKELMWQTLKIESRSSDPNLTPLRLITNQSCCRMTVKKKLSDCSVVGCRLVLLTDEILWVLTDSQLLSAYYLIESLSGLIKKATQESQKAKAARKLESSSSYMANPFHNLGTSPSNQAGSEKDKLGPWSSGYSQSHAPIDQNSMQKFQVFKKFDVVETSYHFFSQRIDLNFCDDPGAGRSCYPELKDGGTLQLILNKVKVDYYPYHLADGERTHWVKYQEGSPYQWTKAALSHFKTNLTDFFNSNKSSHAPLSRASPHSAVTSQQLPDADATGGTSNSFPTKAFVSNQFKRLMSACCMLTCRDLVVYQVTLSKKKSAQTEMLTSDKSRLCLPDGTSFLHLEYSSYYYPGGFNFPVPPPKIFTQISPLKVLFDPLSFLWLNAFACHLMKKTSANAPAPPYLDVHMEVLMPRVLVQPLIAAEKRKGRPKVLQILMSRLIMSNVRSPDPTNPGSRSSLFTCLEAAQKGQLFFATGFPSEEQDRQPIPSKFLRHAEGSDAVRKSYFDSSGNVAQAYSPQTLWTEARDILFFYFDRIWLEFLDKMSSKHSVTMVEPFHLTFWVHIKELSIDLYAAQHDVVNSDSSVPKMEKSYDEKGNRDEASLHIIAYAPSLVSVQFSHLQLIFLMRILDTVTEFSTFLTQDTKDILSKDDDTFLIAGIFPCISLSFIIPPVVPSVEPSLQKTVSLLENLQDLTINSAVDDIHSSPSNPSLSPPSFSEESKDVNMSMTKSQSEGCLASVATSTGISSNLEFQESPNLSKSGESLHASGSTQGSVKNVSCSAIPNTDRVKVSQQVFYEKKISGISSMKKGLTSGFNTLINTIESTVKCPDDSSDTLSIHSDISNDSDNFVMLYLENEQEHCSVNGADCVFKVDLKHPSECVEAATEVIEDVVSSELSEFSHCILSKEYIGVVVFQLGNVQLTYEGEAHDSTLKMLSTTLSYDEMPRISVEEFQDKFSGRSQDDISLSSEHRPCCIKLRLVTNGVCHTESTSESLSMERVMGVTSAASNINQFNPDTESYHPVKKYLEGRYTCKLPVEKMSRMDANITGASVSLLMTSLSGIVDLVEDELLPEPLPMKIRLENAEVQITEKKDNDVKFLEVCRKISVPKLTIIRDANFDVTLMPLYLLPSLDSGIQNLSSWTSDQTLADKRKSAVEDQLRKELQQTKQELQKLQEKNANLTKLLNHLQEDKRSLSQEWDI